MILNLLVAILVYLAFFMFEIGIENFYELDIPRWVVSHLVCIVSIFTILLILN
jgi:type VI protein secretion system component VasK